MTFVIRSICLSNCMSFVPWFGPQESKQSVRPELDATNVSLGRQGRQWSSYFQRSLRFTSSNEHQNGQVRGRKDFQKGDISVCLSRARDFLLVERSVCQVVRPLPKYILSKWKKELDTVAKLLLPNIISIFLLILFLSVSPFCPLPRQTISRCEQVTSPLPSSQYQSRPKN